MSTDKRGIPCPECNFVIPTTFEMLLSGHPIVCPMCALELNVDMEKSVESLKLIKQLQTSIQNVEDVRTRWE